MIGLSSEDSRIIEDSGALSATAILIPRNKMTTRIAKHFSVHSSIKRPPALGEKSRRLVTSRHTNQGECMAIAPKSG